MPAGNQTPALVVQRRPLVEGPGPYIPAVSPIEHHEEQLMNPEPLIKADLLFHNRAEYSPVPPESEV